MKFFRPRAAKDSSVKRVSMSKKRPNLKYKKILRGVIGFLLVAIPLAGLSLFGEAIWIWFAGQFGLNAERPPFALMMAAMLFCVFFNKIPWHSKKTIEVTDWREIDASSETVWSYIHPSEEAAAALPHVSSIAPVSDTDEDDSLWRYQFTYFKNSPRRFQTSVYHVTQCPQRQWLRLETRSAQGSPAWDKRVVWTAYHLIDEGDSTRVHLTKAVQRPKVWAKPLYWLFNPVSHELEHLQATCEGKKRPTTLHDFWLEQFKPDADFTAEDVQSEVDRQVTESWRELSLGHKIFAAVALAGPLIGIVVALSIMDINASV